MTLREKSPTVKVQKRLLLYNIKENHIELKLKIPNLRIGFSAFCQLRLKWYVTVGHSGSHSVPFMSALIARISS